MDINNDPVSSEQEVSEDFESSYSDYRDDDMYEVRPAVVTGTSKGFSAGQSSRSQAKPKRRSTTSRSRKIGRRSTDPIALASELSLKAIDTVRLGAEILKSVCTATPYAQERREAARIALRDAGIHLSPRELNQKVREFEEEFLREGKSPGFLGAEGNAIVITPEKYLIEDYIKEGQLNLLAGPTGAGKTTLLLEIMRALMLGEETFCGAKVNPFGDRHIIYIGVDNTQSFFVNKFGAFGLGSIHQNLDTGNTEYYPHPRLDFDPNNGVFRFTADGMAKFEDRFLKRGGNPLSKPLLIIDSASTVLSTQGVEEKSDLITGMLVDFTMLAQRYDATTIACFHMPKSVTMQDVGARAIRGHGGPPQVAGHIITLGLVDDEENHDNQVRTVPLRILYSGHRGKTLHNVVRMNFETNRTEVLGEFYELHKSGQLRQLITEARGGGPKTQPPEVVLRFAASRLTGKSAQIFNHLASLEVVPNTETHYDEQPKDEFSAREQGYRSSQHIAVELGAPIRTVQAALQPTKALLSERSSAKGRSLVDVVEVPTGKHPLRMFRAYTITDLVNGEY